MKINYLVTITTTVLGIALLLRFVLLGSNPPALYWDELAIGIDAYSVATSGKDINNNDWLQAIFPSYGDFKAPLTIWLTTVTVKLVGLQEVSVRLPFTLISLIGTVGVYLLLRELLYELGEKKGKGPLLLLAVTFLLTSPWHFHFSRIGFESGLSFNLLTFALALILIGLRKQRLLLVAGSLLAGLSIYSYFSVRYIAPVFVVSTLLAFWKKSWKKKWWVLASLLVFISVQIPLYLSPYYTQSQTFRLSAANVFSNSSLILESSTLIYESGNTLLSRMLYHRYWFMFRDFLSNFLQHFDVSFLFLTGDSNLRHHTGWGGQLLLVSFAPLLLGMYWFAKHWKTSVSLLVVTWLLAAPVTAAIPYEVPHASRSIYLLLPLTCLVFLGFIELFSLVGKRISSQTLTALISLIFLINFLLFAEDYFFHYPQRSGRAWQVANTYIGKSLRERKQEASKVYVTPAYWKPALAVLFYNPEYIEVIQQSNGQKPYAWENQFDKFYFETPSLSQDGKEILYYQNPDSTIPLPISETYVFPDGEEALYVVKK